MATAGGNGPLVSHMRPCAPIQCVKWIVDNPPSKRMYFLGLLRVCMALKTLQCCGNASSLEQRSTLSAIHTLNPPPQYIRKLRGLLPIHSMHLRRAQGLMWGPSRAFLPAAAMVGYGCVGQCWPLEADVRLTYCRNSRNCLRKYFFSFLRRSHISLLVRVHIGTLMPAPYK